MCWRLRTAWSSVIHAAGKKTSEELVAAARGTNIFLDGAKAFVEEVGRTG